MKQLTTKGHNDSTDIQRSTKTKHACCTYVVIEDQDGTTYIMCTYLSLTSDELGNGLNAREAS